MGIRGINYDVGTQTGPYLSRAVLDPASYGVVRCYDDGHREPERLFHALAARNARA